MFVWLDSARVARVRWNDDWRRILLWDQSDLGRPVLFTKIFLFPPDPNHPYIRRHPVPLEGRIAIVTSAGRDAMDAKMLLTNSVCADGEVVWS
jgi:hypothetical protein